MNQRIGVDGLHGGGIGKGLLFRPAEQPAEFKGQMGAYPLSRCQKRIAHAPDQFPVFRPIRNSVFKELLYHFRMAQKSFPVLCPDFIIAAHKSPKIFMYNFTYTLYSQNE